MSDHLLTSMNGNQLRKYLWDAFPMGVRNKIDWEPLPVDSGKMIIETETGTEGVEATTS